MQPCGECASCREILERGESLDVHEMDGASNRKIEHARELIETVRYAPQRDRFRIAIIDEVHMLTNEAFNALLKTLEEPPAHTRFILASTELHKIPPTIVSRCQRFAFRALTVKEIAGQLEKVAKAEEIHATPGALRVLAEASEGSLRDALSLLDQASTLAGGKVDDDAAPRSGSRDLERSRGCNRRSRRGPRGRDRAPDPADRGGSDPRIPEGIRRVPRRCVIRRGGRKRGRTKRAARVNVRAIRKKIFSRRLADPTVRGAGRGGRSGPRGPGSS